ncbi:alpha-(1-_6)-mannopyranosyltransferase A [Corynebacterium falsenii]|nr:alpha-(1->6)-mannopyranosyltransferase A [Corynebacterium falsenii]MDC7103690.1 alpha-(1->6)-mannopyranosyltransferase A [Corynebacterium falsenii]
MISDKLRGATYRSGIIIGLVGSIIIMLCSHAVGAIRARGGIMQGLGLTSLTFGHAAGMLLTVMWVGVAGLLVSWIIVGGRILRFGEHLRPSAVAAWIGPLVFAGPLMSRDVYSYLMQGTLTRDGFNPYHDGAASNPGPLLYEVSPDWRNTTTPYGPLHLGIGDAITSITGDNITAGVLAYKALSLISVGIMAWAVVQLARHFGARPAVALWLGVFNPLSIIHLIGGMHNENIMMACVLVAIVLTVKYRPAWGFAGAALIGVGVAIKATAFIAVPFMVWMMVSRFGGNRFFTLLWTGVVSVVAMLASLAGLTVVTSQTWGWVAEVTGNTKVINPLALPSFIASTLAPVLSRFNDDITFNAILAVVRPATAIAMVIAMVAVWLIYRKDEITALKGMTIAYLVTCVLNSVTLPWYYTAPLALIALWAKDRRVIYVTAVLSMWMCMMFDGGGNNRLYELWWVIGLAVAIGWVVMVTLGYRPGLPPAKTDTWYLRCSASGDFIESPSPAPGASPREPGDHAGRLPDDLAENHRR